MIENKNALKSCIGRMVNAYTALELAKADCEDVVSAEIDTFVASINENVSDSMKKSMRDMAKTIATNKANKYRSNVLQAAELVESYFGGDGEDGDEVSE